jgi:pilus assembly protein Flp/PilA
MTSIFKRFFADETGATSIEYALIVSIIGLAIISSLSLVRESLINRFSYIAAELKKS